MKEKPIDVATTEIISVHDQSVAVYREPTDVLNEARKAAQALTDVIANKSKKVIIQGEQYIEFEDWQTLARFYNLSVGIVWTKVIEMDGVTGFEAKAEVIDLKTGNIISSAEAMCMNDENNWKNRPIFMLRSMAQTRACAKALRNVLAWVVVLAGYKPTPAEEMDGVSTSPAPDCATTGTPARSTGKPEANQTTNGAWDGENLANFGKWKDKGMKWKDLPPEYLESLIAKKYAHWEEAQKELDRRAGFSSADEDEDPDKDTPEEQIKKIIKRRNYGDIWDMILEHFKDKINDQFIKSVIAADLSGHGEIATDPQWDQNFAEVMTEYEIDLSDVK